MFAHHCRTALRAVRRFVRHNSTAVQEFEEEVLVPPLHGIPEHVYASSIIHGRSTLPAYQHKPTHRVPVAIIHFRSYFPSLLDQFIHFTSHAAAALAIPVSRAASLPTKRTLWTVPRSPFAHKKSQENFDRRVHKRAVKAWDADPEVVDRWLRYLEEHAMAGVGIRVVRWHRVPVGIGASNLEEVVGRLRVGAPTSKEKVQALGEQIVQQEIAAANPKPAMEATAAGAEANAGSS